MTAFHVKCIGCHRAMQAGPMVCRDCHAQSFHGSRSVIHWDHRAHARQLDMGTGPALKDRCLRCHHKDAHAQSEADYRPCSACHKPAVSLGLELSSGLAFHQKLKHTDCIRCHIQNSPAEGLRTCKDCHTQLAVDKKTRRPPVEQAIHAACMSCHNVANPDLTDNMPSRCDDCHRPDPSVIADVGAGILLWDHDRHAEYGEDMHCNTCHHTDDPQSPHMACGKCHGTGLYENPTLTDALRKLCLGCHQKKRNGLISWKHLVQNQDLVRMFKVEAAEGTFFWDHREHAISWSFSCRNCHHAMLREQGRSVTAARLQLAWDQEATHPKSCRACHGPLGAVDGSPAQGTRAPGLIEALKKACLECHQRLGGGPQKWIDFFLEEPLRPAEEKAR